MCLKATWLHCSNKRGHGLRGSIMSAASQASGAGLRYIAGSASPAKCMLIGCGPTDVELLH